MMAMSLWLMMIVIEWSAVAQVHSVTSVPPSVPPLPTQPSSSSTTSVSPMSSLESPVSSVSSSVAIMLEPSSVSPLLPQSSLVIPTPSSAALESSSVSPLLTLATQLSSSATQSLTPVFSMTPVPSFATPVSSSESSFVTPSLNSATPSVTPGSSSESSFATPSFVTPVLPIETSSIFSSMPSRTFVSSLATSMLEPSASSIEFLSFSTMTPVPSPIPTVFSMNTASSISPATSVSMVSSLVTPATSVTSLSPSVTAVAVSTLTPLPSVAPTESMMTTASVTPLIKCSTVTTGVVTWREAFSLEVVSVGCHNFDPRFSQFVRATRFCNENGQWDDINFFGCTLRALDGQPFLLLWLTLESRLPFDLPDITSAITQDVSSFGSTGLEVIPETDSVTIGPITDVITHILYRASLNRTSTSGIDIGGVRAYVSSVDSISNIPVLRKFQNDEDFGVEGFIPSEECECYRSQSDEQDGQGSGQGLPLRKQRGGSFSPQAPPLNLCVGSLVSPCSCSVGIFMDSSVDVTTLCNCSSPFVGDGATCVVDADGDGYPARHLSSCSPEDQAPYCFSDTCPTVFNMPQSDTSACTFLETNCPMEVDVFGIAWGSTAPGQEVNQPCGQEYLGNATRFCRLDGTWMEANVTQCFAIALQVADTVTSTINLEVYTPEAAEELLDVVEGVAVVTMDDGFSKLPSELGTAAEVTSEVVDYLLRGLEEGQGADELAEQSLPILDILSNVVDPVNLQGSEALMEMDPMAASTFSNNLLNAVERYGTYLSVVLDMMSNGTGGEMIIARDNIVVSAQSLPVDNLVNIVFPPTNLNVNSSNATSILNRVGEASITIPVSVLSQRAAIRNSGTVRVSSVLYQNVLDFLSVNSTRFNVNDSSIILSSQVESQRIFDTFVDPVVLTFTLNNNASEDVSCVFYDFDTSGFSDEGLQTISVDRTSDDRTIVQCSSSHLTSFAVLVNVAGVAVDALPLRIISYIGLALSLVFLLATIIFFLTFGKKLFTAGVHNFVHLNLAISLFVADLIFAIGVELGASSVVSCQVVAALLHYFFLAVFSWMLCEGVMLYLMLYVVFSELSKKWWFFLLLGWLLPIPFLTIGLSIPSTRFGYGIYDNSGNILYCWLSSESKAIWTFVAPMLAIIVVNTIFLVLVLFSLIKNLRRKMKYKKDGKRMDLVTSIIKSSFILLPLLGLTWVLGLFAANENSLVFAWVFTIFNSLQGVFIFFFHVLRHEKIWGRCKRKYSPLQSSTSSSGVKSTSNRYNKLRSGYVSTSHGDTYKLQDAGSTISSSSARMEKKDHADMHCLFFANEACEEMEMQEAKLEFN